MRKQRFYDTIAENIGVSSERIIMKPELGLLQKLMDYSQSEEYPMHMPGHKRRELAFPNPYSIDITEIEGFDNLHHATGILKDSMEWAATVYGTLHTYYLVNGSSGGILSGICAAIVNGGTILMGRNCHKSAYHGAILNQLKTVYVYPQIIGSLGIQGGILATDVENLIQENPDIQGVLIVSPTYDGIVSDISAIAEVVHKRGLPLLVDEAHGAHFPFDQSGAFPPSALEQGADLVIQSLHKTLPSFTQTAVLHINSDRISCARVEQYLQMFQSSSPSYVLMAGIETCILEMEKHGTLEMEAFGKRLEEVYQQLDQMKHLQCLGKAYKGVCGVYDLDPSKIVISGKGCVRIQSNETIPVDGIWMADYLRENHHLELELCGSDYVVALTSFYDTTQGLCDLVQGILELDQMVTRSEEPALEVKALKKKPMAVYSLTKAINMKYEERIFSQCSDCISAEFIYLYPPGIPMVVPGELVTEEMIYQVEQYKGLGLSIQGMADHEIERLRVLACDRNED